MEMEILSDHVPDVVTMTDASHGHGLTSDDYVIAELVIDSLAIGWPLKSEGCYRLSAARASGVAMNNNHTAAAGRSCQPSPSP